jgi:transcriptional regulator with XRE-family HTH domain
VLPICNVTLNTHKPIDRGLPSESDKSLGACLKRIRLGLGLSQEQFARKLKVLTTNYIKFERNLHIPTIKKRKKINEILGYNFWDDGSSSLGNQLLLYRIEEGITAKECGVRIGVSRNTIKRLETEVYISNKMKQIINRFLKNILFSEADIIP